MKKLLLITTALVIFSSTQAQLGNLFGKKKKEQTKDSANVETPKEEKKESKKGGPNLFSRLIVKVAKVTGGAMQTAATDDLSTVVPSLYYITNLPPGNLGTAEMAFFEGWKTNGSQTLIMFTKKDGYGFNKIKGTVMVDGKPAEFITMGIYSSFSTDNNTPKKIEVTSDKGQRASFTVHPQKYDVKIAAINGSKDETVNLDPAKDLVLELENPPGSEGTTIAVRLLVKTIGISYWSELGYFPSANKITIPAAYFRNVNNTNGSMTNFKKSYFSVTRSGTDKATDVTGIYSSVDYTDTYNTGRYANINPDIEVSKGITVKGSDKFSDGPVEYEFTKANAFNSMAFNKIKNIGVLSFAVRGILYDHKSSTKYNIGGNSYTTTTKTLQFPQLPDEKWDFVLNELYQRLTQVIKEELNAPILPIEKITGTDAYTRMEQFSKDDENTTVELSRGYHGLKVISNFVPVTDQWGPNNNMSKLIKQSGANAILKVTLDLQVAWDGNKGVLVPKLATELLGATNGDFPTKYFTSLIIGKGYKLDDIKEGSQLTTVIRIEDLVTQFSKGLQALKQKEKENGDYNIIWDSK